MRCLFALSLLLAFLTSADARPIRHHKSPSPVVLTNPDAWLGYPELRRAYAAQRPAIQFNDTPRYDDPSRFGGSYVGADP